MIISNPESAGIVKIEGETRNNIEFFGEAEINLEATPAYDYNFEQWISSNGGSFENITNHMTTFTTPDDNTTITANFEIEQSPVLQFENVHDIQFGEIPIQGNLTTINRKDTNWSKSVRDTRGEGSTWNIYASVNSPLTSDNGHTLEEAIVFKNNRGEIVFKKI